MMPRISDSISSWKISRCSIVRCSASWSVMAMACGGAAAVAGGRTGSLNGRGEKVAEHLAAVLGEDRLRMELDALDGSSRWRTAMISPSSAVAVTSSAGGRLARSMASEW
jgi:hypothetical protein